MRSLWALSLVRLRMDVSRSGSRSARYNAVRLASTKELQSSLDVRVLRVQLSSSLISIESVCDLVVATLVQSTEIIPYFGDVWVQANGPRIRVQSITVLVDLIVQHTNGAPECRVSPVAVNSLLIGLISLRILLLRHVAPPKQIPALRIAVV